MNYGRIKAYMEMHDFLEADRQKIYDYIEQHNRVTTESYNFIDGYLTRKELILTAKNGIKTEVSRLYLGIQENYI